MTIAVLGPMGPDECAHYLLDGLAALGQQVRPVDPLRVRCILNQYGGQQMINDCNTYRKPISLTWLKEHESEVSKISDCSILIITDQICEYVNDLPPLDEAGNRPIVLFYHNEYDQPPSILNGVDIAMYGQPQLRALTHAMYPWASSAWRREFDLVGAVFPERFTVVPYDNKAYPGITWIGDNFVGKHGNGATTWGRWHSLAYDVWHTYDDKVNEARAQGITMLDDQPEITHEMYIEWLGQSRGHLIMQPDHIWCSRRLFECIAVGSIPIIHVQHERTGSDWDPAHVRHARNTHEKFLADLGFLDGVNCFLFTDFRRLKFIDKLLKDPDNRELVENITAAGYKLMMERHTFKQRAQQILDEIQLYRDIVARPMVEMTEAADGSYSLPYEKREMQL